MYDVTTKLFKLIGTQEAREIATTHAPCRQFVIMMLNASVRFGCAIVRGNDSVLRLLKILTRSTDIEDAAVNELACQTVRTKDNRVKRLTFDSTLSSTTDSNEFGGSNGGVTDSMFGSQRRDILSDSVTESETLQADVERYLIESRRYLMSEYTKPGDNKELYGNVDNNDVHNNEFDDAITNNSSFTIYATSTLRDSEVANAVSAKTKTDSSFLSLSSSSSSSLSQPRNDDDSVETGGDNNNEDESLADEGCDIGHNERARNVDGISRKSNVKSNEGINGFDSNRDRDSTSGNGTVSSDALRSYLSSWPLEMYARDKCATFQIDASGLSEDALRTFVALYLVLLMRERCRRNIDGNGRNTERKNDGATFDSSDIIDSNLFRNIVTRCTEWTNELRKMYPQNYVVSRSTDSLAEGLTEYVLDSFDDWNDSFDTMDEALESFDRFETRNKRVNVAQIAKHGSSNATMVTGMERNLTPTTTTTTAKTTAAIESQRSKVNVNVAQCVATAVVTFYIFGNGDIDVVMFLLRFCTAIKYPGQYLKSVLLLMGTSDSGKSELVSEIVRYVFSSRVSGTISNATLRHGGKDEINTDLMSMMQSHVCQCDEPEKLNSELFKNLISNTKQKCRAFFNQQPLSLTNMAKLILTTNDDIHVRSDAGVLTRLKYIVKMTHRFKKLHANDWDTATDFDDAHATPSVSYQFASRCFAAGVDFKKFRIGLFLVIEHFCSDMTNFNEALYIIPDLISRSQSKLSCPSEIEELTFDANSSASDLEHSIELFWLFARDHTVLIDRDATDDNDLRVAFGDDNLKKRKRIATAKATNAKRFKTTPSIASFEPIDIPVIPYEMMRAKHELHLAIDPYESFVHSYEVTETSVSKITEAALTDLLTTFLKESGLAVQRGDHQLFSSRIKQRLRVKFPQSYDANARTFALNVTPR